MHDFSIPSLFLVLAAMLIAAKLLGELAERFGQPAVLGELVAGVLLGGSVLGIIPVEAGVPRSFIVLAELGVVLLLFEIGLETDLKEMFRVGPASLSVAAVGVVLPFALGFAYWAYLPHAAAGTEPISRWPPSSWALRSPPHRSASPLGSLRSWPDEHARRPRSSSGPRSSMMCWDSSFSPLCRAWLQGPLSTPSESLRVLRGGGRFSGGRRARGTVRRPAALRPRRPDAGPLRVCWSLPSPLHWDSRPRRLWSGPL